MVRSLFLSLEEKERLLLLLKGALDARDKVGLKLNVREKDLYKVLKLLPSLKKPTVSFLTLKDWVAVEVVIDEKSVLVTHVPPYGLQDKVYFGMHGGSKEIRELEETEIKIIYCTNCGNESSKYANYCKNCGNALKK